MFYVGLASRLCDGDPAVWHDPKVDNCSTVETTRITEEVKEIMATFAAIQDPNNSDRTVTIEPDALDSITDDLANATDHNDTVILPNDLENSLDTVEAVLRYIYKYAIYPYYLYIEQLVMLLYKYQLPEVMLWIFT